MIGRKLLASNFQRRKVYQKCRLKFTLWGVPKALVMPHTGYMSIKYSELTTTTEYGAVCYPCSEYKGMVDCPECGVAFCLFCEDWCPECGESIDYSA